MNYSLLSASSVLGTIGSVLLAILILLAMITVHEFGHYIAGKIFKFKINEFAIGFGPAIYKHKKKNGEFFSIRCLPLGGYCAFEGEDGVEKEPAPDSFNAKKPWQRIIVLFAGAFMNYLFALLLIMISFFSYGQLMVMTGKVEVAEESVYNVYSLHDSDVILECEGKDIYLTSDLMEVLEGKKKGDLVSINVSRAEEEGRVRKTVQVMLRADAKFENLTRTDVLWDALGIAKTEDNSQYLVYSVSYKGFGFFETVGRSFIYSFRIGGTIFKVLGQLLTGNLGLSAFGGPVSTIKITSEVASRGVQSFLEIAAFIGVNLAVFNLLPIPALDGSKIVFTLIEWVRGKPVNRKVEAAIHAVGFILLIGFALLVDFLQLF